MDPNVQNPLIQKETISPGHTFVQFLPGARVKFHYQTRKCDTDNTIIDDSRSIGQPMDLVIGKKFKLEVWEVIVQKLAIGEVAKFTVHEDLVTQYPFVSKTIRDSRKPQYDRKHCCGMTLQNEGLGYKDLDELFTTPVPLQFIIELLSVEQPNEYQKESWQYSDTEKLDQVQVLKNIGNKYYAEGDYYKAEDSYRTALGYLEQLMLKEKPNDEEWNQMAQSKVPLLLNYSQCKLLSKDYYAVIEHCTEAIKYDPKNVKAYYRRAKANVGAWNPKEAEQDFKECLKLDKGLTNCVNDDLKKLKEEIMKKNIDDKKVYHKMF